MVVCSIDIKLVCVICKLICFDHVFDLCIEPVDHPYKLLSHAWLSKVTQLTVLQD